MKHADRHAHRTSSAVARKLEAVEHARSEANAPKSRLLDLVRRLEEAGARKEAASLDRIVARLEAWQAR